jgi:hypothetical protein
MSATRSRSFFSLFIVASARQEGERSLPNRQDSWTAGREEISLNEDLTVLQFLKWHHERETDNRGQVCHAL